VSAEVVVPLRLDRRTGAIVVVTGVLAGLAAAVASVYFAAVNPAGPRTGPTLFSLRPSHGVHIGDLVATVSAFGTAIGLVAAVGGAVVRWGPPRG